MQSSLLLKLLIFITLSYSTWATISSHFKKFLVESYGKQVADSLARTDLGAIGSFGGGAKKNNKTALKPVIMVHGITNSAGTFAMIGKHFTNHGYHNNQVFATTYGDAGKTNVLMVTMECRFIMQVRMFIQAVSEYTNSKVDIVAYSMGSPVARKAILGGQCVDTGRDIGPSITALVDTFIGVAGANHGSVLCFIPFGSCNMINGLNCNSRFIADVNSKKHYEGNKIITLYSTGDDKVGFMACGQIASSIAGENQHHQRTGMNHDQVIFDTADFQLKLLKENQ
uniref:Lipase_3 domain-containing protein n=1 Tax=Rhabditophanes sp. KR3021 TaxID=114890 RepID=A0AC35U545_9BILA